MKTATTTLVHVYEVYIRTTPEKLWQALTDSEFTKNYFFGGTIRSEWRVGSPIAHIGPSGEPMLEGEIVEIARPHKLVHSFQPKQIKNGETPDPPSRVTYEITPMGEVSKLTLTHEHFAGETTTSKSTQMGWGIVLSSLKTLLETGKPLAISLPDGKGSCGG
jgi:uncharacterized protein YndB with AHSA1/START domain